MKYQECSCDELMNLVESFMAYLDLQYNNNLITQQEYEDFTCKKKDFLYHNRKEALI